MAEGLVEGHGRELLRLAPFSLQVHLPEDLVQVAFVDVRLYHVHEESTLSVKDVVEGLLARLWTAEPGQILQN